MTCSDRRPDDADANQLGPESKPTDECRQKVIMLVVCGFAPARIAAFLGVKKSVLRKHFANELKNGRDMANADVAASLYRSAMNGRVSAQIFWMKAMAARHEADSGTVSSGDGPARSARKIEPSDREVARRIAFMLDRAARSEGA
jgi:hypothetical protein